MADRVRYSHDEAAVLHDVLYPWGPDDAFYLALVMEAGAVLDVGAGGDDCFAVRARTATPRR
jgi:hypothetical protein